MTYLAPRQGLFAIIILISFCLQTLLLVLSTEQQVKESQQQKGEQMVSQLINEASLALQNRDRVSLSVIAGRYTSEQDVARLVIKDANDKVLVPLGNAPMQQGKTIRQVATKGDAVIGSVALTLKATSKGEIIAHQWPFVIGSLLLHLFLWLLYGYVARPTKTQINALSRDIHEHYRQHYQPVNSTSRAQMLEEYADADIAAESNSTEFANSHLDDLEKHAPHKRWGLFAHHSGDQQLATDSASNQQKPDIHDELNSYLKTQQESSKNNHKSTDQRSDVEEPISTSANRTETAAETTIESKEQSTSSGNGDKPMLAANRAVDVVDIRIIYDDNYRLLDKLAPETADPYFALCSQLLNQAITELLKQPLLHGVKLMNEPRFDHSGALVVLKADNTHSKVALAGAMLGKLYIMLNQIIYDKHRELSRFALPIKIGVSDDKQARPLNQLLESVGKRNEMLMLFPKSGFKQVGNHMQMRNLPRPTTVHERECAFFDGTNEAMMQRLIDVRNAVLLTGSEDA